MTERIRELARTAEREVQISLGERWTTVGRAEFMRLYNEKFANLIVQECASICDSAADNHADEITPLVADKLIIAGAKAQAAKLSLSIKEHFGVE